MYWGICFPSTHKCERNSRKYKINKEKTEVNLKSSDVRELFR